MTAAVADLDRQAADLRAGRYLRVVNYHNTPAAMAGQLERELAAYARRFASVTFDDLDRFFDTGTWELDRPGFLPVFYEGYRNNAEVAAPICDELGIVGWFPVATGFIDTPVPRQRAFADAHHITLVEEELSADRLAMTWDDVARIGRRHMIFPHTASHEARDAIVTDADIEREIIAPRRAVEKATGRPAPGFVYLHGTQYGESERHDDAVRAAGYRYMFSNTLIQRIA